MNRLIFPLILACQIAVTTPVSAEEIKLTTIVPDQTVMKAKKGAIGDTYSAIADGSIPTSALLVQGTIGIGTQTPSSATKLDVNGGMRLAPTTQPVSPQEGMIYYDSVLKTMRYWNGGWVDMVGGGGGGAFGMITGGGTGSSYLASTDGFVMAYLYGPGAVFNIRGFTDSNPNPSVEVASSRFQNQSGFVSCAYIMFPVRKNNYWKVTVSSSGVTPVVLWMPVGN